MTIILIKGGIIFSSITGFPYNMNIWIRRPPKQPQPSHCATILNSMCTLLSVFVTYPQFHHYISCLSLLSIYICLENNLTGKKIHEQGRNWAYVKYLISLGQKILTDGIPLCSTRCPLKKWRSGVCNFSFSRVSEENSTHFAVHHIIFLNICCNLVWCFR